jgi:hypothetical protein
VVELVGEEEVEEEGVTVEGDEVPDLGPVEFFLWK